MITRQRSLVNRDQPVGTELRSRMPLCKSHCKPTYHGNAQERCRRDANHAYLRSVGRGQEFVLDLAHYPEAVEWLSNLVAYLGANARTW